MKGKRLLLTIVLAISACTATMMAQQSDTSTGKALRPKSAAKRSVKGDEQNEGQRIFEMRCSSCHNAPEGFSPRISGTVVRHMRVRACLSKHEDEELLRFFNP